MILTAFRKISGLPGQLLIQIYYLIATITKLFLSVWGEKKPPPPAASLHEREITPVLPPKLPPSIIKAMVLFRACHPQLIPQDFSATLVECLEAWKDFLGPAGQSVLKCLNFLTSDASLNTSKRSEFCKELEEDVKNSPIHYIPFYYVDNHTVYTTILKIQKEGDDQFSFQDVYSLAYWKPAKEKWDFSELLMWNRSCLQRDFSQSNPLRPSSPSAPTRDGLLPSSPTFSLVLMGLFLKKTYSVGGKLKKLNDRMEVLQKLVSEFPTWTSHAHCVQWVKGALAHLERSIDALLQNNKNDAAQLHAHRRFCDRLSEKAHEACPKSDSPLDPTLLSFPLIDLQFSKTSPLPKSVQISTSNSKGVVEEKKVQLPQMHPNFTLNNPTVEDYVNQAKIVHDWVDLAKEAFEKRDFQTLTTLCTAFLEKLPTPQEAHDFFFKANSCSYNISHEKGNSSQTVPVKTNFFKLTKKLFGRIVFQIDDEQSVEWFYHTGSVANLWAIPLFKMTYFLIHTQMLQLKTSPRVLKHILKGLALQYRLCDIATVQDRHASSPLRQYLLPQFLKGFQNYAADFGEEGGEILEILKTMRKAYSVGSKHAHPFNSDLPIYGCQEQIAAITAHALACYVDLLCSPIALTLNRSHDNSDQNYRQLNQQAVTRYLQGVERLRNGQMMHVKHNGYHIYSYEIFPFNGIYWRRFNTGSPFFASHVGSEISNFKHLSTPLHNPHLRHFIQQGLLTTQNELSGNGLGVDKEKFELYQDKQAIEDVEDVRSFPNTFLGENKTQRVVHQEKQSIPGLSNVIFQDLQLMQTSSLSRARNTLATFERHPHLLSHTAYGHDFQTIFSLNLFRDAAIYREWTCHPENISTHFAQIDRLIEYHHRRSHYEVVLFLIDVRSKMIGLLQSTLHYQSWDFGMIQQVQTSQVKWSETVEGWWKNETPSLQPFKALFSRHILAHYARNRTPIKGEEALQSLFLMALTFANAPIHSETSEELCQTIDHYLASYHSYFSEYVQKHTPAAFIEKVMPNRRPTSWKKMDEKTWESENLSFCTDTLTFQLRGECRGLLPLFIRNHSVLNALDPERHIQREQKMTPVVWSQQLWRQQELGWSFQFRHYQVVFHPQKPDEIRIYRTHKDKTEQLITPQDDNQLPLPCQKAFWWKDLQSGQLRIENRSGHEIYRYKDKILRRVSLGEEEEILDHADQRLSRLTGDKRCELIRTKNKGIIASFPEFNCRYVWDTVHQRWEAEFLRGYYLCETPLSAVAYMTSIEHPAVPLFPSSFDHYHLLEKKDDPQAPKKLILAPLSYQRGVSSRESKYQIYTQPTVSDFSWGPSPGVFIFDIDLQGQLSTSDSNGYLYLSYLFLTQRQYLSAMTYLRLGQIVADYSRELWRTAAHWITVWDDPCPEAKALKLHFYLSEQHLRKWRIENIEETAQNDEALVELMKSYEAYQTYENQVPAYLKLTENDRKLIGKLEPRALQRDDQGIIQQPQWKLISQNTRSYIKSSLTARQVIERLLTEELSEYEKSVKVTPLTLESPIEDSLQVVSLDAVIEPSNNSQALDSCLNELQSVLKGSDLKTQELGQTLIQDVKDYLSLKHFQFKKDANLKPLKDQFFQLFSDWKKKRQQAELRLIPLFQLPQHTRSEEKKRLLQDIFTTLPELIAQAQMCYSENNYQPLIEKGLVKPNDCVHLDRLLDEYLSHRIMEQHWERKIKAIEQYQQQKLHETNCIETLRAQPLYDMHDAALRRTFKVIEVVLNLSIRETQLSSLIEQIKHVNSFKHAGTGSGKTSLQRHLLLRLKSLQNQVGGQVTHRELFYTHHRELAHKERSAFNTTVFPFQSTRHDKLTLYGLQQIERRLWMALKEKALLDHTPSDALSFKNRFATAFLDSIEEDVFQQFQKVRQLHQQLLSVSSDELMAVADPSKDHNFSYGSAQHLEEVVYDTCLDLFNLISSTPRLADFFKLLQLNQLKTLTKKQFSDALDHIAQEVVVQEGYPQQHPSYQLLWGYLRQDYLGKDPTGYEQAINRLPPHTKKRFHCLHRYFEIFKDYHLNKRLGVHFGRSKDRLTTKPFRKSAYCMESSQRSDVATTVFETCFDYTARGVTEDHIKAFIEMKKQKTGQDLSSCSVQELVVKINSSGEQRKDFLKTVYFSHFTYYPRKIEGTSSHLPNQYKELSGSSASADRIDTLPHAIERTPGLLRQKGDIGEKFYHFMAHFSSESNLIAVKPLEPISPQIAPHFKKGDVLIDLAPFFPGEPAEVIAKDLASYIEPPEQNMRFIDEAGKLKTLKPGQANDAMSGVLSHPHTEGTDWKFNNGFITHSITTSLTEFYQGMRTRQLGRGQHLYLATDVNWSEIETLFPQLAHQSRLTQILFLLIHNEALTLAKLKHLRLIKDIQALAYNSIDNLLLTIQDKTIRDQLRALSPIQKILAPTADVDIEQLGSFRKNGQPREQLKKLAQEKIEILNQVIEKAQGLCNCLPLQQAVEKLSNIETLLPPDHQLLLSTDNIEDLEIEVEQDHMTEELNVNEVDLALDVSIQQTITQDNEEFYQRSVSDVGREIETTPFEEALRLTLNQPLIHPPETFAIDGFNNRLWISAHALGYPSGLAVTLPIQQRFWFQGHLEPLVMGREIAFLSRQGDSNNKFAVLMSAKDADLFLSRHALKKNPLDKALEKNPLDKALEKNQKIDWRIWDVHDTQFPAWADEHDKKSMVYAKIIFVNCDFSPEQLKMAQQLLNSLGNDLNSKLHKYLLTNGIEPSQCPLIPILT